VVLDLNDLFMFTGWPLVLLAAVAAWHAARSLASRGAAKEGAVMTAAALLTLVIIDLYGTPRGEWGRIMIFMSPWLLLAAGSRVGTAPRAGWPITAVQGAIACTMIVCLQVLAPEFRGHAAPVPPSGKLPASSQDVYAGTSTFGESLRLAAVSGKVEIQVAADGSEQSALFLWLTWDAIQPMNEANAYVVQPVSASGAPLGEPAFISPFTDSYPMTCWKPADGPLIDRIKIPLPGGTAASRWVSLRVADPSTGQPLSVVDASGAASARVILGPYH
jgi:hypothetical protein